jgi:branched-chain amino acid transport system substrate-binding protein
VRIGVVGTQSGVIGSILADGPKAVQAWASAVNDRGGLGCHHVEYLIRDDGGDPSRHQALVRELVEERGVIALVQENAPLSGQASVQYLTEHGIPVIGSETGSTWFYQSPMFFPQASSGDLSSYMVIGASAVSGKAFGLHKLAVVSCIEAAACNRLYELAPDLAARNGLDLVYRVQASLVQPDYTSLCQSAKGAGAEIMLVALDSNAIERVGRSCNAVLFRPKFVIPQSAGTPQLLENPVFEGLIVGVNVMPWMVANPAIDEYRRVLGRYAPGLPVGPTSIVGWVSAKLFERAARRLSEPPTSKDILEGLWSLRNDDLDGVTYPLTFTKGQTAPVVLCYWVAQIRNHSYVSPDGGQRRCASV